MSHSSTVVLDIGSHTIKAGNGLNFPSDTSPEVITSSFVRDSEGAVRGAVDKGEVTDWEALDSLLDYILYEKLFWERGNEGTLVLCEPLLVTRSEREKMSLLLFERFGVEGVCVQDASVLSLYSVGRLSGCVLDLGHTKTDISPVYEGLLRTQGIRRLEICGKSLTRCLRTQLVDLDISEDLCGQAKEALITLSDKEDDIETKTTVPESEEDQMYTLPDGETIKLSMKQCRVMGEAFLNPQLVQQTGPGIADAIYSATFGQSDIPSKRQHLEAIFLCGGGSSIPNLQSRLFRELQCFLPHSVQPGFCSVPEYMPATTQKYAAWMGGAILSKVVIQHGHLATKSDYDEMGPSVLHRKFQTAF